MNNKEIKEIRHILADQIIEQNGKTKEYKEARQFPWNAWVPRICRVTSESDRTVKIDFEVPIYGMGDTEKDALRVLAEEILVELRIQNIPELD